MLNELTAAPLFDPTAVATKPLERPIAQLVEQTTAKLY